MNNDLTTEAPDGPLFAVLSVNRATGRREFLTVEENGFVTDDIDRAGETAHAYDVLFRNPDIALIIVQLESPRP